jgi:hypothetical protein
MLLTLLADMSYQDHVEQLLCTRAYTEGQPLAATSRQAPSRLPCFPPSHPPCPAHPTPPGPHPQAHYEVEGSDRQGQPSTSIFDFVPAEVLGAGAGYAPEPRWSSLPQMPYMEFYQGLRERNWTTKYYNQAAEKWSLQFFQDRCGWAVGKEEGVAGVEEDAGSCARVLWRLFAPPAAAAVGIWWNWVAACQNLWRPVTHPCQQPHTNNRTPANTSLSCLQRPLHAPLL